MGISAPLCSPTKAGPPHSSPQGWDPTQAGPGCFPAQSMPCGAARAVSVVMLPLSLRQFLQFFAQDFVFPVPYPGASSEPGWPRGAWILGDEAVRDNEGCSHFPTPRVGSQSSVLFLHPPSIFGFCPLHRSQTLGASPSLGVPARVTHCRGSVYFK